MSCFGAEKWIQEGPGDRLWSDIDPGCGCGLDLGGDPACWIDNPAVNQLPPGPYAELACSVDWAWAIRADDGEFVVQVLDKPDQINMEVGARVRDVLQHELRYGDPYCFLTYEEGQVICDDPRYPDTEFVLPEGEFETLQEVAGMGCAFRADGTAECFRIQGGSFPGEVPAWPALKEASDGMGLTLDGELIELLPGEWSEQYSLELGGLYVSHVSVWGGRQYEMGIPLEDPYMVDCRPDAIEEMDVVPPGWE